MSVERIEEFSERPERTKWKKSEMVKALTAAKVGEKFRETYESEFARKMAQKCIRSFLSWRGINVKTQGWQSIAEFERLK